MAGYGMCVVDSAEYVRDTALPKGGLFEGVNVEAMLELTRRTIATGPPPEIEARARDNQET